LLPTEELTRALGWLDAHRDMESVGPSAGPPDLGAVTALADALGDPQRAYPVVHVTGTNGKGSTTRVLSALLAVMGLSVGTYTSPDLGRVNERLARNGVPVGDEDLTELLRRLGPLEQSVGVSASRFELLTVAAFTWFADLAVDVAVVEVGMGGDTDATNIVQAAVAVVTNVALDHTELLGPTVADIAGHKAGIVKPGSTLVLGETDEALAEVFLRAPAARAYRRGPDFGARANLPAVGGRLLDLYTPASSYDQLFLSLLGRHQGDNAAIALAAAEAFFDAPLPASLVEVALGGVTSPGRMEVASRHPLCLLDGAHNAAAAAALGSSLDEEIGDRPRRIVVMGVLAERDPGQLLDALGTAAVSLVIGCTPASPRGLPGSAVAEAASRRGLSAVSVGSAADAVTLALAHAGEEAVVVVTGSLYVVGEARAALGVG
ncbi:MAG: bifunctional folylpolyglutamate synthase/dihydrofolate synthase, partial [Acidimicrobiales bacterium]